MDEEYEEPTNIHEVCEDCEAPYLMSGNYVSWKVWMLCHSHDREYGFGLGSINTDAIAQEMQRRGGRMEDYDKVLLIESAAYPLLKKQSDINSDKKQQENKAKKAPSKNSRMPSSMQSLMGD